MRNFILSFVALISLSFGYANTNANESRASETKLETGNEKSEAKKPQPEANPENGGIPESILYSDSTATTVKFNYLFYLIYKLKYGQEPPAELIDSDI